MIKSLNSTLFHNVWEGDRQTNAQTRIRTSQLNRVKDRLSENIM